MYLTQLISPKFKIDRYAIVVLFLLSANEVAERQCFTPVCQSFCSQGEVYTPLGRHPPGRHPLADTQTLPWQTRPVWQTPLADTPLDSHCSGRYPSYWNVFLDSNGKHHLSHALRVSCLWEICGVCGQKKQQQTDIFRLQVSTWNMILVSIEFVWSVLICFVWFGFIFCFLIIPEFKYLVFLM